MMEMKIEKLLENLIDAIFRNLELNDGANETDHDQRSRRTNDAEPIERDFCQNFEHLQRHRDPMANQHERIELRPTIPKIRFGILKNTIWNRKKYEYECINYDFDTNINSEKYTVWNLENIRFGIVKIYDLKS